MKLTYLLLNIFTILVPFVRSFEQKIAFYKKWKFFVPANLITSAFFLTWDYFKTSNGVWSFNDSYILGPRLFGMPLEEYLFFLTVPYACTFIYETVSLFIKNTVLPFALRNISLVISILCFISSFFFMHKAYTFSVLFIIGLLLPLFIFSMSWQKADKMILMYVISLIPMLVVNGLLTALPVVIYNDNQNLGIRLGTIPVEDFVYNAILLFMTISLYEWQQRKDIKTTAVSEPVAA